MNFHRNIFAFLALVTAALAQPYSNVQRNVVDDTMVGKLAAVGASIAGATNVRQYGAVGDGTTNDAAAVTAALAAAGANGVVVFPPGTYLLSSGPISIPASGMRIIGYGATLKGVTQTDYRRLRVNTLSGVIIEGLTFEGLYTNATTGLGNGAVEITVSTDCAVRNCVFNNIAQSGVAITGACVRVAVANCSFYKNFCAILSDDDGTTGPIAVRITGNSFRTGLGTTSTAYSGAVKFSGVNTMTANTQGNHVIADNTIFNPGQMGIELNLWVNGSTVIGNTVDGAGTGISIANAAKDTVSGNSLKACGTGIEIASSAILCSVNGNVIDGKNGAGAVVGDYGITVVSSSTDIAVVGNTVSNTGSLGIQVFVATAVTISGNILKCSAGASIDLHQCYHATVVGNTVTAPTNAVVYGVDVDVSGSSGTYYGFSIIGNVFKGEFGYSIVRFLSTSGSAAIEGVTVSENDVSEASADDSAIQFSFSGSTTVIKGLSSHDNRGKNSYTYNLDQIVVPATNSGTVAIYERAWFCDATGGAINATLPDPAKLYGWKFLLKKNDASVNAVTLVGTIDGASNYALSAQYKYVEVQSNGTSWFIIGKN